MWKPWKLISPLRDTLVNWFWSFLVSTFAVYFYHDIINTKKNYQFCFLFFFHFNPTIYPCRLHFLSPTPPTLHVPIPPPLPPLPLYWEIWYDLRANNELQTNHRAWISKILFFTFKINCSVISSEKKLPCFLSVFWKARPISSCSIHQFSSRWNLSSADFKVTLKIHQLN